MKKDDIMVVDNVVVETVQEAPVEVTEQVVEETKTEEAKEAAPAEAKLKKKSGGKAKAKKDSKPKADAPKAEKPKKAAKVNKEQVNVPVITLMNNDELKRLFLDNGCATHTNASVGSKVVYNTFGTKSRVLQQQKGYQLLLTNGHKEVKKEIVACENDDTARFVAWYGTLTDAEKAFVDGMDTIGTVALSRSEMPRERTVKLTSYDLLVKFIQHMGTFEENKLVAVS